MILKTWRKHRNKKEREKIRNELSSFSSYCPTFLYCFLLIFLCPYHFLYFLFDFFFLPPVKRLRSILLRRKILSNIFSFNFASDSSLIQVHPCGRYRHNTVVFILAKEYNLKNLRTIHRLDRLTSGLLLFGRSPKKARQMEHQIRNRQVQKQYVCRVEGEFPE